MRIRSFLPKEQTNKTTGGNHNHAQILLSAFSCPAHAICTPSYSQTIVDNTYINTRFHYTFTLPEGFNVLSETDNGDGIRLEAKDGKAVLSVWTHDIARTGSFLSEIRQYFDRVIKEWARTRNWHIDTSDLNDEYAIWRATKDNKKLYNFTIPYCDSGMTNISLIYDISEEQYYAALIPTLIKSLKMLSKACQ
ncbi:MAG: Hypothetical protein BHV28_00770 [Candidatus Tokpelaia hoelldobleri]|uniref:Uncharacterized protein n=1 Tax=Candidatus Tokpelaia hoelldobleri TaxID=1902579 RepID=A0A1U9JSG3_9HYPH|nr:MAG: Hypothetical protein BHV28_00770 [Candidatus Tokpelaia hoelldoblerii]